VVSSQRDDTGECLACARETVLVGGGVGLAHEEAVVPFLNLLDRPGVVVPASVSTYIFRY
jgi:hypothetical protein